MPKDVNKLFIDMFNYWDYIWHVSNIPSRKHTRTLLKICLLMYTWDKAEVKSTIPPCFNLKSIFIMQSYTIQNTDIKIKHTGISEENKVFDSSSFILFLTTPVLVTGSAAKSSDKFCWCCNSSTFAWPISASATKT